MLHRLVDQIGTRHRTAGESHSCGHWHPRTSVHVNVHPRRHRHSHHPHPATSQPKSAQLSAMNMDSQPSEQPPAATAEGTGNMIFNDFFNRAQNTHSLPSVSTPSSPFPGSITTQPETGTALSITAYTGGNGLEPSSEQHSSEASGMDIDHGNSDNHEPGPFMRMGTNAFDDATTASILSGNITPTLIPATRAATLLQYADREIVAKKLRGESKDKFIKWCSVRCSLFPTSLQRR